MSLAFADSFYFLAVLNQQDPWHDLVKEATRTYDGLFVTTGFVLLEVADAVSKNPVGRSMVEQMIRDMKSRQPNRVLPCSEELFLAGLDRYARRPDKQWSLTDCISFVVMEREGIADALTGDKHFEQAGFNVLLK
jgi:predicted nucleic acid-binding protein